MAERNEQFVQQLIGCQPRIYAYILSLAADADRADEILQDTNLVLWRKAGEFVPGTNFIAWAFRIAHFQVLAKRQKDDRDRHVFDDELLETLARETHEPATQADLRVGALRVCLGHISQPQRQLLERRYGGESVQSIADKTGRTVGSISQTLYRIRGALVDCIRQKLTEGK